MHSDTKKRRLKFTGIAMLAAMVFSALLFLGVSKSFDRTMLTLVLLAGLATGLSGWPLWTLIMRSGETKFRGAWCGALTVILAYPILAILMAFFDNSSIGKIDYILATTLLGITMTGIFTIPLGGFFGQKVAKNVDTKVSNLAP